VRERARDILSAAGAGEGGGFVAVAPGAAYGPAKQWGGANFAEVARLAGERGAATVVVGTAADSPAAAEIARLASGARVTDLAGRTDLLELAGVLSLASWFVGNDSGAAHLAAALGVPTGVVYLSTDPRRTGQRGERVTLLVADVDCRPCMRRRCPRGDYACRAAVRPSEAVGVISAGRGGAGP
jgi:heptosyltransferase-2